MWFLIAYFMFTWPYQIIESEGGNTLLYPHCFFYVGLARTAPPTNTKFPVYFSTNLTSRGCLWRINCIEHQIWNLPSPFWPQFHSGSQFLAPPKTVISCDLSESVCRVGTHCFTHQYKLLVNFFTPPTSGSYLWRHTCIEHHFSSLSFIAEVNF